jgi:diguanylate cyclase (GGDEF)-like protein
MSPDVDRGALAVRVPGGRPIIEVMDSLADLPGLPEFDTLLEREELRRARTGERLAVAVLDLDGLRAANARQGAAAGTEMLRRCADSLRRSLRAVDDVARTGPDEFSVLLHATDARGAARWAERFEYVLATSVERHPRTDPPAAAAPTCSLGIADTSEAPTLMEVAARARSRMEVIQRARRQREARESGT